MLLGIELFRMAQLERGQPSDANGCSSHALERRYDCILLCVTSSQQGLEGWPDTTPVVLARAQCSLLILLPTTTNSMWI